MCAFALATSSSPLDVLRHYHHVRLEAIHEQKQNNDIKISVSLSLKMYMNTLKDTQAVVPAQLPQALRGLKSAPILGNAEILDLVELNLDLYEKNLGDDIRIFTPYIRLEDLQKSDFENLLKNWAKEAFSTLLSNLRADLKKIDDAHQLMALRTETLQLWFSNQQYATGVSSAEVVDQLRDIFTSQWSLIVERQAASLAQVSLTMNEIFRDGQDRLSDDDLSLWTSPMLSPETTNGAKKFREALTTRLQGRSGALKLAFDQYARWTAAINAIEDSIKKASAIKWVDDLDDIEDDDEMLNDKQILLSEDDPRTVSKGLSESVKSAFNELQELLQQATDDLEDERAAQRAVLLLRLWREIRQNLPNCYHNVSLGLDAIRSLHALIARTAAKAPLERVKVRARKTYSKAKVSGKLLWEGTPPMPRLPSPWAFRLLHELSHSMANIGSDVWSPQLTVFMKQHLRESLASDFQELTETEPSDSGHQNEGHDPERGEERAGFMQDVGDELDAEESTSARVESNGALLNGGVHETPPNRRPQEVQVQRLFDLLYLTNVTATEKQELDDDALHEIQISAERDLGLAPESVKRMKKGADEYWKRTSLLFGLLA